MPACQVTWAYEFPGRYLIPGEFPGIFVVSQVRRFNVRVPGPIILSTRRAAVVAVIADRSVLRSVGYTGKLNHV